MTSRRSVRFADVIQPSRGVFLIHNGDPSHTAHATQQYLANDPDHGWRSRPTPVHASWLNQAEILINNFFSAHDLKRQSWTSRKRSDPPSFWSGAVGH